MTNLDLRPLSLGEILDQTFSLYRQNFVLFVGIAALPQLLLLAVNFAQVWLARVTATAVAGGARSHVSPTTLVGGAIGLLVGLVAFLIAYLFAQGGTVYAVSELYLGRATTIVASLRNMNGHFWSLFGVSILNGLAVGAATILLIIPGIYVACRLITCIPAALLENLMPGESLSRSFALTEKNAGRAFLIYLLYFTLLMVALGLLMFPFTLAAVASAKNPATAHLWSMASQVGNSLAAILVTPVLTIATAVFYYDLRVRKEGFDLQLMMNQVGGTVPRAAEAPTTLA